LNAGRDPYFSGASFHFNAVRFRFRGYDNELFSTYMNGVPMENLDNGFTPFGLWGGLNDVMRNREATLGLRTTTFAFGELGGSTNFDTRASHQRKQTSVNYAISNRNYANRLMITHSTGLNKKGWAFTFSGSRRWATEGYADGTYYDGWSFFTAVDKRVNDRHLLSFVAFVTPTENGRQGSSVQEMTEITGDRFYNSFWGYQNGKKRNASVAKTSQPVGILTHDWRINEKSTLVTAASFSFGKRSVSGLDWYNAPDPRPDYYRYLPSYQTNPLYKQQVLDAMRNNVNLRQLNWDGFYNANRSSFDVVANANGIAGNTVSGRRSRYILEDRIINTTRYSINTTLNTTIGSNIDFTSGLTFQRQNSGYYKEVNDLLGGDFYVDVNQFAERILIGDPAANQNDVNNPNRILKAGDKFGYNYDINTTKASGWVQAVIKFRKIDIFLGGEHSYTRFQRIGNVKSGLFPNNSFGKSKANHFYNHAVKAGITYKFDGRNYLFANGSIMSRAPFFENAYIAPRQRDFVQDDIKSEGIYAAEAGYIMNAPKLKLRATGYYTRFTNQVNVLTFYHEDYRNFVNYAISNIGKQHMGIELGVDAKIYKGLSVNAAANIGRYYYNTRQNAVVTLDNDASQLSREVIYSENFRVPTPQEAYTIGLDYRSPRFWFVNVNFNYFSQMWLDFNPIRRTYSAVEGLDPFSDKWRNIIDQEKLESQYTVDAFAGYSWRMNNRFKSLKKTTYLVFNMGINNLLNNTSIVSGGFEQLRFDYTDRNPEKFPARKFYSYGLNYFASVGVRF
jgi:TonB dependent receptor